MPTRVTCPRCGASLRVREGPASGRGRCPACGGMVELTPPAPAGPANGPQQAPAGRKGGVNIPAVVGLPLAFLAWPAVALCFFIIFRQLIQSLVAGGAVAAAALGCGVAGLVVYMRRGGTAGALLAVADIAIARACIVMFTVAALLASAASERLPPQMSVLKQVIGTEPAARVRMKCRSCGHEFEVTATELLQRRAALAARALRGGRDLDQVLDEVEREARQGLVCPKCGQPAARPVLTCPRCGKTFEAPQAGEGGPVCPHCGARLPTEAVGLMDLYRIPGDLSE